MLVTWLLTIPASALVAAAAYGLTQPPLPVAAVSLVLLGALVAVGVRREAGSSYGAGEVKDALEARCAPGQDREPAIA